MKQQELVDAIGELPEEMIAPVAELRKKKPIRWIPWVALAACLCLALLPLAWQGVSMDSLYSKAENEERYPAESPESAGDRYGGLTDNDGSQQMFRAEVLEIYDTYMLVRPLEGEAELKSGSKIEISFAKVQHLPILAVGDKVEITYSGRLQEVYPVRAEEVVAIRIIQ